MTPMNTDKLRKTNARVGATFFVFLSVSIGAHRWPLSEALAATTQPTQAEAALVAEFGERMLRSRYMERGPTRDVVVPGWEGFPTKRHTYAVTDKDGTKKSADVVMLNPMPEQVARWIVSAIVEVRGRYDADLGRKTFAHVIAQSGGQFPVAGVVYEDIIPADGVKETYCFRDGVTVAVEGVKHRGTAVLTPAEIEASVSGKVLRSYTYARIQSTSPSQYVAIGGRADVIGADGKATLEWPLEVRRAYQAAWTSERNALMVAWIKAQP